MPKRFLIPLLLAPVLLAGCGSSSQPTAPAAPSESEPSVSPPPPVGRGPAGMSVTDGALTVTAVTIKPEKEAAYPGGLPDPDHPQQGWFVVADVLEENAGVQPVTPGDFYAQTADGRRWEQVVEPAHDPQLLSTASPTVAAGDKQRGSVVFDMPEPHGQVVYGHDGMPLYRWTF